MRFATALLALAALASQLPARAQEVPLMDFFKLPQYTSVSIAPDGKNLAALAPVKGRQNLVVLDIAKRSAQPLTSFESRDVVEYRWVNSKRLVLRTGTLGERQADSRGGGLFAIDVDGGNVRQLAEGSDEMRGNEASRYVFRAVQIIRRIPGESDEIIAQEVVFELAANRQVAGPVFRLDTRTGRRSNLSLGKPGSGETESWIVDNKAVARGFTVQNRGKVSIYYRSGADDPWLLVEERDAIAPGLAPLAANEAGRGLYVLSHKDRDRASVHLWDPATKSLGPALAEHPLVDITEPLMDFGTLVGVSYKSGRRGFAYFDEGLARVQLRIDKALPNTVNFLTWSQDRSKFLITTYSDVLPASYYLMDAKSGKVEWLADAMPWIKPAQMAKREPVRYKARDGQDVPAFLTLPRGSSGKNLPLVVVVHGGPWVPSAEWGFDPEAQFLASRGYAVLQPDFRGTIGYGWKHFRSSFRQWGLTMQDDITDGVRWAVAQGLADKNRVCIYGASYGGYAVMMGLAKDPELYRCGVNFVGVTDIETMLSASWSDFANSDFLRYSARDMMGDAAEADKLAAVSPVKQAAKIRAPVLMAYGGDDRRVPIVHGNMMRSALEANGKKYEWMVFDGEGHGFRSPDNQAKFYGSVERFLKENLAAGP